MPHLGGPRPKGLGLNPNAPFSTLYFYGGAPMPYSGAPTTLMPVTLPPGRFRLATTPISTGPSGRLSRHPKAKHMDIQLLDFIRAVPMSFFNTATPQVRPDHLTGTIY